MGMLDSAMLDPATFDPAIYGAGGPGMLAGIPLSAWAAGMPAPVQPTTANYGGGGGTFMPMPPPPGMPPGSPASPLPDPVNVGPGNYAMPPGQSPLGSPGVVGPNDMGAVEAPAAQGGQPAAPSTSLLGRINDALSGVRGKINDNSNVLLAVAAGMAGAPNLGVGMSRAFAGAVPAAQADQRQQYANADYNAIRNRLIAKGMSPDDAHQTAMAAQGNPPLMQQMLPGLFGAKQWQLTEITDMFGGKKPILVDPISGATKALDLSGGGSPSGPGGVGTGGVGIGAGGPAPASAGRPTLSNFDPSKVDSNVKGWDYFTQYPQEVEAAARAYMSGGVMPTGNPRSNGIATVAKMAAQKVAMDLGHPELADDTSYPARRELATGLAKDSPGSPGGMLTFGGTSLGHLADVAEKATNLGNVSGFGMAPVASWANWARGLKTDQAAKVNEVTGATQHYGQEITKFYTGSPGGEAERMRFLNTINTSKSPQEIAGAIRTERDLIPDRINQLGAQIAERLGPEEAQKQLARANVPGQVARINKALAKLDPDGPEAKMQAAENAAPAAPSSPSVPAPVVPEAVRSLPMSQQMLQAPEGSIVRFGSQRLIKTGGKWQPAQQ